MSVYVDMGSVQFENANAMRKYPFADGSSLIDRHGNVLPEDIVVDLHMVVPYGDSAPAARLSSVHLSPYMVSVCFVSESEFPVALSVRVSRETFTPYVPYRLEKLVGSEDAGGIVTFGDIAFPGQPETYFLDGATVHPCCVAAASPARLREFVDLRSGESVRGDAEITFSGHVDARRNGKSVSLSLADGSAATLASECAAAIGPEACGATPIRSINGVRPDASGNIVLWFH